jgi:hypothetical protein
VQPYALTGLFAILGAALAAVSVYAFTGGDNPRRLIVGLAAAAVAAWFVTLSISAFRHGKR